MSLGRTADVRVYLFAYRRNHLLPRALESLRRQSHENWVCEVHNDDPDDPVPGQLVRELNDSRFHYVQHATNLGGTATFNLAFRPTAEPWVSILEDDNWWEPELLQTLLAVLTARPEASVSWANMWLWQEEADGTWTRTGTVWPVEAADPLTVFATRQPRQVFGPLHSNGAMLVRSTHLHRYLVPEQTPFFAMEAIRDRLFEWPMVLVRQPLANFAITRENSRNESADQNLQVLTLLAMTGCGQATNRDFSRRVWVESRGSRGHRHRALVAGAVLGRRWAMLAAAPWRDLALVVSWAVLHPVRFARLFAARNRFPELAAFLGQTARERSEARP